MATFHTSENPNDMGVYEVLIKIHGIWHPRPHEPTIYAYFDGIDTWGAWEFSKSAALRARPTFKGIHPWKKVLDRQSEM